MSEATLESRESREHLEAVETTNAPRLIINEAATDEQRAVLLKLEDLVFGHPLIVREVIEVLMDGPINPKVQRLLRDEAREAETTVLGVLGLKADIVSEYDEVTEAAIQSDPTFKSLKNQDRLTPAKTSAATAEKVRASNEQAREQRRLLRIGVYAGRVATTKEPEQASQDADVA